MATSTNFSSNRLTIFVISFSCFFIVFAFEYIAGGHLFPLDIIPPALERILNFSPFPYQLFFPVSIYLGRATGGELWRGLGIQLFWVAAFYLIARAVWGRGIRKYT